MSGNVPADPETLARVYRSLRLIRRTEEEIASIYPSDKIKSPVHLSIGQESVSVGVCDILDASDVISATYRGHAAYLAKGGDLKQMMAELYGKGTGCAAGKAGSMHLIDMDANVLGMSAVVGTTIPVAAGYAFALKREGKGRIAASFFGDGATEALCERVRTFGIETQELADDDVFAIREAAGQAAQAIRGGEGPQFIECKTYRWLEHVGPGEDYDDGYRTRDELDAWQARDQVAATGAMLDDAERQVIDDEVESLIAEAVDFAEQSPWPEPEELYSHVLAD